MNLIQIKGMKSKGGKAYAIPKAIAEKYVIHSKEKAKKESNVSSEELFSEIEARFTKAGVLLRGLRVREGMTQEQFAKKIQVTQANLSNMETGKRPIGKRIAKRIQKIFDTDYRYFLE